MCGPPDADDAEQLATRELKHRTKNILAIVQSLVKQTLRDGADIAQARDAIDRRLAAMGRGIDLLLKVDWAATELDALARAALSHHDGYGTRVRFGGPAVAIGPNAALTLAMTLHELESNAIKYGALARDGGGVALSWTVEGTRLRIEWRESGCGAVAKPARTGFGTRLISDVPMRRFGGTAWLDWGEDGVVWTFEAPLDQLAR
jgi:two-component sensor histidine kinase